MFDVGVRAGMEKAAGKGIFTYTQDLLNRPDSGHDYVYRHDGKNMKKKVKSFNGRVAMMRSMSNASINGNFHSAPGSMVGYDKKTKRYWGYFENGVKDQADRPAGTSISFHRDIFKEKQGKRRVAAAANNHAVNVFEPMASKATSLQADPIISMAGAEDVFDIAKKHHIRRRNIKGALIASGVLAATVGGMYAHNKRRR